MKLITITAVTTILFCGCGSGSNVPKVVPGAGGAQLYELMEEDSTEQKVDSVRVEAQPRAE